MYSAIGSPALSHTARKALSTASVLSLGQIYSMMRYDSWEGDPQDVEERRRGAIEQGVDIDAHPTGGQRLTFRESHEILLGAPSRDFLPSSIAAGIHRHLTGFWGMAHPMVGLLVDPAVAQRVPFMPVDVSGVAGDGVTDAPGGIGVEIAAEAEDLIE